MNHGLAKQHSTFAPLSLSLYCGGSRNPQAFQKRTWAENPALKKKGILILQVPLPNLPSNPQRTRKQQDQYATEKGHLAGNRETTIGL